MISLFSAFGLLLSQAAGAPTPDLQSARPDSQGLLQACRQLPACDEHLDRADRAYEQNQSSEAVQEYLAAYALSPYPLILYNLARLHHKERRLPEAVEYYQRYLATADTQREERVRHLLREAQDELRSRSAVASPQLAVASPRPGVAVVAPGPPPQARPLYKRPWFWAVVGSVVAAGVIGGAVAAAWPRPWQPDAGIDSVPIFLTTRGGIR